MDNVSFEQIKQLHKTIRSDAKLSSQHKLRRKLGTGTWEYPIRHREMLLLWAFVRGFKFRRIERTHRMDCGKEIVGLEADWLLKVWSIYLPTITVGEIKAWLEDPTGAIPAPPPRPKKPYIAAAE